MRRFREEHTQGIIIWGESHYIKITSPYSHFLSSESEIKSKLKYNVHTLPQCFSVIWGLHAVSSMFLNVFLFIGSQLKKSKL